MDRLFHRWQNHLIGLSFRPKFPAVIQRDYRDTVIMFRRRFRLTVVLRTGALLLALCISGVASAQAPNTGARNSLGLPVDPALLNNLPEVKGVVSWSTLAKVKSAQTGSKVVPQFDQTVRALDRQEVKLQGFMLPIVTGELHQHFLLTMRPPHCPFCLSLGPEYIVEVRSSKPIKHTYEPIVLSGRFAVLNDDPFGLYYRLTEANLTAASR